MVEICNYWHNLTSHCLFSIKPICFLFIVPPCPEWVVGFGSCHSGGSLPGSHSDKLKLTRAKLKTERRDVNNYRRPCGAGSESWLIFSSNKILIGSFNCSRYTTTISAISHHHDFPSLTFRRSSGSFHKSFISLNKYPISQCQVVRGEGVCWIPFCGLSAHFLLRLSPWLVFPSARPHRI